MSGNEEKVVTNSKVQKEPEMTIPQKTSYKWFFFCFIHLREEHGCLAKILSSRSGIIMAMQIRLSIRIYRIRK